ncbi:CBASS cGAMP-activated phospholipase [Halothiobacillus sp.]|uniref:CBASS cGAMP-activated phospholipase n=1 Tax=Halothiobacillus sp. TaxID=1891311 RepID=UPI002639120C|nr:CBASS cGAMP-activated phospholipase [Halothiobacillus sp.]
MSAAIKRRILTIDGGGLKGIVPAAFLAELEKQVERPLHEYFDLIVGTSTGGIIAAGIACGMRAEEIVDIYKKSGPRIFPTGNWFTRLKLWMNWVVRTKYPTSVLRAELEHHFQEALIGDARTRLVIPSWNPTGQGVYIWKTRHCGRFRLDHSKPIVEALVSTASAPTYFSSSLKRGGTGLIDGGVWANNPMLVAAVEAVGVLGWNAHDVYMLALGCIKEDYIPPSGGGLLRWALPAPTVFMQGQSSGAVGGTYLLLGDRPNAPERVFRLEASVPSGKFALDGANNLDQMERMGRDFARQRLDHLLSLFFRDQVTPFVPLPKEALDEEVA